MRCVSAASAALCCKPLVPKSWRHSHVARSAAGASISLVSPHPDAIRRREEAEAQKATRDLERMLEKASEASGQKWWHLKEPLPNVFLVSTRADFEKLVSEATAARKLLVCNFFSENCYACRSLAPKFVRIATDNPDVWFVKLNGGEDSLQPMFEDFQITKVPFFQLYVDSQVVSQFSASLDPAKLAYLRMEIATKKKAVASG